MSTRTESSLSPNRRPRSLALDVVDALGDRMRGGTLAPGDKLPTETEIMGEFGVSRTVVREALSKLQASGLVQTKHGIGTFVLGASSSAPFRINAEQLETLNDVIAVLELRMGLEVEAAGLAAQRRTEQNLAAMREALVAFSAALDEGRDSIGADYLFHLEIARATRNPHFVSMMGALGSSSIPRSRLDPAKPEDAERLAYLRYVNREHESILDAIVNQDGEAARAAMRTHIGNSRERRRKAAALGQS
jgi:GntR family transcriptional regulator, transcriptional repressor for pyruvate dehydrogenase complex